MTDLTLTDFLLARIAEDEAVARAASPGEWATQVMQHVNHDPEGEWLTVEVVREDDDDEELADFGGMEVISYGTRVEPGGHSQENAEHIARPRPRPRAGRVRGEAADRDDAGAIPEAQGLGRRARIRR